MHSEIPSKIEDSIVSLIDKIDFFGSARAENIDLLINPADQNSN